MSSSKLSDLEEFKSAYEVVLNDKENLQSWEALISITLQYGVDSIEDARNVFDQLLINFPLLFGYWIQYAKLETEYSKKFNQSSDAVIAVYERAVNAFPLSYDLWTQYCSYLRQAGVENDKIRSVYQRGVEYSGRDFLSHSLWDSYIDFEDSIENDSVNLAKILKIVIKYPMHQYAKYYEKCSELAEKYPQLFTDIDLQEVFENTQTGTNDRWAFESQITRNYFHVVDLEDDQVVNWNNYLDYEESQGNIEQIRFLYERALVPTALYELFWLRYVRWAIVNVNIEVEGKIIIDNDYINNIYHRACLIFLPLTKPHLRIHWSLYEESIDKLDYAREILQTYQNSCPIDLLEEIYYSRIQFERRQSIHNAIEYIDKELQSDDKRVKESEKLPGLLLSNKAILLWKSNDINLAREIFETNKESPTVLSSAPFFINYFKFELSLASVTNSITLLHSLWKYIIVRSYIPPLVIDDISQLYISFLQKEGYYKEQLEVDLETNGPYSIQKLHRLKVGGEPYVSNRLKLSNGHPGVEIDMISVTYEKIDPLDKYLRDQK